MGCWIRHLCLLTFQHNKVRLLELAYFFGFPHFTSLFLFFMERVANRLFHNMTFSFLTAPIRTFISFSFSCDPFSFRSFSVDARSSFFLPRFRGLYDVFLPSQSFVGSHLFGAVTCVTMVLAYGVVSLNISCSEVFLRCSYLFTSLLIRFLSSCFPHPLCCRR